MQRNISNQEANAQASKTHTPGPWKVETERGILDIVSTGAGNIAMVSRSQLAGDSDANAALIAAAPDLLAALSNLNYLTNCQANKKQAPQPHCDCCTCLGSLQAIAAIAKAGAK